MSKTPFEGMYAPIWRQPQFPGDNEALLYRATNPGTGWKLVYVGLGRTFEPYLERDCQCTACSHVTCSVMPERTEFPLECYECGRMTVWPKRPDPPSSN